MNEQDDLRHAYGTAMQALAAAGDLINERGDRITRLRALIRAYRAHADVSGPDQWHAVLDAEHALERGDMEDAQ